MAHVISFIAQARVIEPMLAIYTPVPNYLSSRVLVVSHTVCIVIIL